jgi:predicted phage baseplate assembly protein
LIQFGDGVTGARVPSGRGNVIANYRYKLGLEGRLTTGQLSIPLDRPVGLKEVLNPAATEGGADPEELAQARETAPTTVKTFGRAVSLLDFEALATASGEVAKAKATWVWRGLEKAVHLTVAGQLGSTFSTESLNRLHSGLTQQRDPNHVLLISNVCRAAIVVTARLVLDARYDGDTVKEAARQALLDAFSFEQVNFAQAVHLSDIYRILQDVTGVVGVDIDNLHFKGYANWTAAQLAARGATADAVQGHLRIFAARSLSATTSNDPVVKACFGSAPLPEVLPSEQAYIQSSSADLNLTVVANLV